LRECGMNSDMDSYRLQVENAVAYLAERISEPPEITIILGTGLGALGENVTPSLIVPYREIPGFPRATAAGHAGNLIFGRLAGRWRCCRGAFIIMKVIRPGS
ncbi:MAG: hypothetical protein ABR605_09410, partial [Desulfurivibrionaceae bacterium]